MQGVQHMLFLHNMTKKNVKIFKNFLRKGAKNAKSRVFCPGFLCSSSYNDLRLSGVSFCAVFEYIETARASFAFGFDAEFPGVGQLFDHPHQYKGDNQCTDCDSEAADELCLEYARASTVEETGDGR